MGRNNANTETFKRTDMLTIYYQKVKTKKSLSTVMCTCSICYIQILFYQPVIYWIPIFIKGDICLFEKVKIQIKSILFLMLDIK